MTKQIHVSTLRNHLQTSRIQYNRGPCSSWQMKWTFFRFKCPSILCRCETTTYNYNYGFHCCSIIYTIKKLTVDFLTISNRSNTISNFTVYHLFFYHLLLQYIHNWKKSEEQSTQIFCITLKCSHPGTYRVFIKYCVFFRII